MIKEAYYVKRIKDTPFIRPVKVYLHFGDSGSGKSYTAQKIIDEIGEENVYFLSDYDGGGFDNYNGQKILFLDKFKGQIPTTTSQTESTCTDRIPASEYKDRTTLTADKFVSVDEYEQAELPFN